jgi:uncharacterized protein (DUF2225 family)
MENSNQPNQVEVLVINDDDYYKIGQAIKSKKHNHFIYIKLDNQDNGTKFYFENDIMYAKHITNPLQQVWPTSRLKEMQKKQKPQVESTESTTTEKEEFSIEDMGKLNKEIEQLKDNPDFMKDFEEMVNNGTFTVTDV